MDPGQDFCLILIATATSVTLGRQGVTKVKLVSSAKSRFDSVASSVGREASFKIARAKQNLQTAMQTFSFHVERSKRLGTSSPSAMAEAYESLEGWRNTLKETLAAAETRMKEEIASTKRNVDEVVHACERDFHLQRFALASIKRRIDPLRTINENARTTLQMVEIDIDKTMAGWDTNFRSLMKRKLNDRHQYGDDNKRPFYAKTEAD